MGKVIKEKIILGLDPGTNIMGYGLICIKGSAITLLQYGVIHLSKYAGHELKLKKVFESSDYQNDWDGGGLPSGIYFYTLQTPCMEAYKGTVTIIR